MPSAIVVRVFAAVLPLLVPVIAQARDAAVPASRPVAANGHAPNRPVVLEQADDVLHFTLDDGSIEAVANITNNDGHDHTYAAAWLNRFPAGHPLTIDTISIFWVAGTGLEVGMQPMLVAYYDADADGDPSNAQRLGSDEIVTIDSLSQFQTYPVDFTVPGAGDVYIGFVDLWAHVADGIPQLIAAAGRDTSGTSCRSYVAYNRSTTTTTDINQLGNNGVVGVLDALGLPGNLMIRATGVGSASDSIYSDGFDINSCTWYTVRQ